MIIFTTQGSIEENTNPRRVYPENKIHRLSRYIENIHLTYPSFNLEDSGDNLKIYFKKGNPRRYGQNHQTDGSLDKYKPRLVAKGNSRKEGVDYIETFASTTKWGTIRALFSLVAQNGWKIHYIDVKTAFLNGDLKEDVYMFQREGFFVKGKE